MGFETYEEAEAWAADYDLDGDDLIAGVVYGPDGYEAETESYRPLERVASGVLVSWLGGDHDADGIVMAELELRGVGVWRCGGCDRWLADTPTAHINHSADCEANGR